jgi:hypothetical protein
MIIIVIIMIMLVLMMIIITITTLMMMLLIEICIFVEYCLGSCICKQKIRVCSGLFFVYFLFLQLLV